MTTTTQVRKWTLEALQVNAAPFKNRAEWKKNFPGAYARARKNGWLDLCCGHMIAMKKPDGYWSLARCQEEALKYQSKAEWERSSKGSYVKAVKKHWIDLCCPHMTTKLYYGPRTIRKFLFSADIEHVVEHKFKGDSIVRKYPFDFYLPKYNLVIEYHGKQHDINSRPFRRTKEDQLEAVNRDKIKKDWCKQHRVCYLSILDWEVKCDEDIIDKIIKKINIINKLRQLPIELFENRRQLTDEEQKQCASLTKWTLEACQEDALKYQSKVDWAKNSASAYAIAKRNKWLDLCCSHMTILWQEKWSKEACILDAKKYPTKTDWVKNSSWAYEKALQKGWLDECCSHMSISTSAKGLRTLEFCQNDAKKYPTKSEWMRNSPQTYHKAHKSGWIDQCCGHMVALWEKKWTLETCQKDALKYQSKSEWRKHSCGYNAALQKGWLNLCCGHMKVLHKPNRSWTLEACQKDALKYKSKAEWRKNSASACTIAFRNGWKDQCCAHMNLPH